jgi:exodeoxyribonuclease V gamma subunit
VEQYTGEKIDSPWDFDFELSGFMLLGRLSDIYSHGYIHMRYATRKAKDLLKLWIHHLIYCELKPAKFPDNSFLICKDRIENMNRPLNPRKILETLLDLYRQGLTKPIHFFPETSLAYVQQSQNEKNTRQKALMGARSKWMGSGFELSFAESDDPYYQRCFENTDPIDEDFEAIAKQVYEPLLAHLEKV